MFKSNLRRLCKKLTFCNGKLDSFFYYRSTPCETFQTLCGGPCHSSSSQLVRKEPITRMYNVPFRNVTVISNKLMHTSPISAAPEEMLRKKLGKGKGQVKVNYRKRKRELVVPLAVQLMDNMKNQNVLSVGSAVTDLESTKINQDKKGVRIERLAHEIESAQHAVEIANMDQGYEDKDETDYVETISLVSKSDVEAREKDEKFKSAQMMFGSPDPSVPVSHVPCSGCGAKLHCQDPEIPGYLPSQRFTQIPVEKLRDSTCQRCTLMNKFDMALNVNVQPEEYRKVVAQIKDKRALCLVVVDMLDPENSLFPGLMDLIGKNRPLYIVGNKVDLLPKDGDGYLNRARQTLLDVCRSKGLVMDAYIHHVALVSAKTGYGIEALISKLMMTWGRKGDVYILGCTNVGKSTIFNALLGSDFCRSVASEFINRATTCRWPGTTLNLLKFPIVDPSPMRLRKRRERLLEQHQQLMEEIKHRKDTRGKTPWEQLIGFVGRSFTAQDSIVFPGSWFGYKGASYTFNAERGEFMETGRSKESLPEVGFNEHLYKNSRWCYDTPGVVNMHQIINLLTQHELKHLMPTKPIVPRTVTLKPSRTLFITGLAQIDYLEGPCTIYVTYIGRTTLPMHVVNEWEIQDFLKEYLGTNILKIPVGDEERIEKLPPMVGSEFTIQGKGYKESAADITLSSLGWVAITASTNKEVKVRVSTPGGHGVGLRSPSMLSAAVNLRGKRRRHTAHYAIRPNKPIDFNQEYTHALQYKYKPHEDGQKGETGERRTADVRRNKTDDRNLSADKRMRKKDKVNRSERNWERSSGEKPVGKSWVGKGHGRREMVTLLSDDL